MKKNKLIVFSILLLLLFTVETKAAPVTGENGLPAVGTVANNINQNNSSNSEQINCRNQANYSACASVGYCKWSSSYGCIHINSDSNSGEQVEQTNCATYGISECVKHSGCELKKVNGSSTPSCVNKIGNNAGSSGNSGSDFSGVTGGGGTASNTGTKPSSSSSGNIKVVGDDKEEATCDSLLGTNTATGKLVHDAYNIIKYAAPLILIAFSIGNYIQAIVAQDADKLKKANNNLFMRIIIVIVILITPTILNYIFELIGIDTCVL